MNSGVKLINLATQLIDTQEEEVQKTLNQTHIVEHRDLAQTSYVMFSAGVVHSRQMYFDRLEEINIYIPLKKLYYADENEDTTAVAKAKLNFEDTALPELVKDLIRSQVFSDTQSLRAELGQLKRQLATLTDKPRILLGGQTIGPSTTKK